MLMTIEQSRIALQRIQRLILGLSGGQSMMFANGFGGLLKKYGLKLQTQVDTRAELGENWTIEFFVKMRGQIETVPTVAGLHFALIDDNDNAMVFCLSKAAKVNGYASEGFFLGDIQIRDKVVYFDDLGVTLADGQRHHVYIEHQTKSSSANIVVYVDGVLVVANKFDTTITNFRKLIFGGDAFIDEPNVANLGVYEPIRILGESPNLTASTVPDTITVPTGNLEITESTLMIYQDGMFNIYLSDSEE